MTGIQDLIRRFFAWFWGKILHRTGYRALVDGQIILACGDCGFNKLLVLYQLPAHYCTTSFNDHGDFNAIYDPCDIPEFCPHRVMPSGDDS
jgi:hypothetical protein